MINRRFFVLGMPLALAACGAQSVWAPDDVINAKIYRNDGPTRLTLLTMKNTSSNNGAHTSLIINASQSVIWDPAGTFATPSIPERNDVLFGISPRIEEFYISYHARTTYYAVIQELDVPPATAELALQKVLAYGAVPKANCTRSTSLILQTLPGFGQIKTTFFPNKLEEQWAKIPGVRTREVRENDSDDKSIAAREITAAIQQEGL
jgi:hypothetical protein